MQTDEADVNSIDGLHSAICKINTHEYDMVKLLLNYGADVNCFGYLTSPFTRAVTYGNMETAKMLLERGAKLNERDLVNVCYYYGEPELVNVMINKGAPVEGIKDDNSPLEYAVSCARQKKCS